jgi:hypothetical protein
MYGCERRARRMDFIRCKSASKKQSKKIIKYNSQIFAHCLSMLTATSALVAASEPLQKKPTLCSDDLAGPLCGLRQWLGAFADLGAGDGVRQIDRGFSEHKTLRLRSIDHGNRPGSYAVHGYPGPGLWGCPPDELWSVRHTGTADSLRHQRFDETLPVPWDGMSSGWRPVF